MDFNRFYYAVFLVGYTNGQLRNAAKIASIALAYNYNDLPDSVIVKKVVYNCIRDAHSAGVVFDNVHKFEVFLRRIHMKLKQG